MRIYFHKITTGNYIFGTDVGMSVWWDVILLEEIYKPGLEQLKRIICEKFASAEFDNELRFRIIDSSDEAFFLVWSSDGMEI